MALKVGITGGIGSGKSLVCNIFSKLGVPVFNADQVAKDIMQNNHQVRNHLIQHFGEDIYLENGTIHRRKLADIIFNDKIALEKVNSIVHPEVRESFNTWAINQEVPYVLQETAILFENQLEKFFDRTILVKAEEDLKIQRVIKRDGLTEEKIREIMNNQLTDSLKEQKADYTIRNNNDQLIIPEILEIDKKIREEWQSLVNG